MQKCNMVFTDGEIKEIVDGLLAAKCESGHSQKDIEKATGINQSQVSRFLSGDFKRVSKNLKLICEYAKSSSGFPKERALARMSSDIDQAIENVWDGTDKHAKAIAEVIKSLAQFNVKE